MLVSTYFHIQLAYALFHSPALQEVEPPAELLRARMLPPAPPAAAVQAPIRQPAGEAAGGVEGEAGHESQFITGRSRLRDAMADGTASSEEWRHLVSGLGPRM